MTDKTTRPSWIPEQLWREVEAINHSVALERERRAIYDEFNGNGHSMSYEIQRLRKLLGDQP